MLFEIFVKMFLKFQIQSNIKDENYYQKKKNSMRWAVFSNTHVHTHTNSFLMNKLSQNWSRFSEKKTHQTTNRKKIV